MPERANVDTRSEVREARRLEDAMMRIKRAEKGLWHPQVPAWIVFAGRYFDAPGDRLHGADYRLLLALCYHADWQDKWGKISLRRTANAFGLRHHQRLAESLWKLDRLGIIEARRIERFDGSNGSIEYRVNYRPPFAWEPPQLGDPQDDDDLPVDEIPGEGQPSGEPGREAVNDSTVVAINAFLDPARHRAGDTHSTTNRTPLPSPDKNQETEEPERQPEALREEKDAPRGATSAPHGAGPSSPGNGNVARAVAPRPSIRVDGALRDWCSANVPNIAPGEALRAFLKHHEAKDTDWSNRDWKRAFKGWCRNAAVRKAKDTGRRFEPALKGQGALTKQLEALRGQIVPGSDQEQRTWSVMMRLFRQIGGPAWTSWFAGSTWRYELGCVVITLPRRSTALHEEKVGEDIALAVAETINRHATYRLEAGKD